MTEDQGAARGTRKPGGAEGGRSHGRTVCSTDLGQVAGTEVLSGVEGLKGDSAGRAGGLGRPGGGEQTGLTGRNSTHIDIRGTDRELLNAPLG